jgi:hypothetical protein
VKFSRNHEVHEAARRFNKSAARIELPAGISPDRLIFFVFLCVLGGQLFYRINSFIRAVLLSKK